MLLVGDEHRRDSLKAPLTCRQRWVDNGHMGWGVVTICQSPRAEFARGGSRGGAMDAHAWTTLARCCYLPLRHTTTWSLTVNHFSTKISCTCHVVSYYYVCQNVPLQGYIGYICTRREAEKTTELGALALVGRCPLHQQIAWSNKKLTNAQGVKDYFETLLGIL